MNASEREHGQLPESLRGKFAELERRLWRIDTVIALCGALAGLLISYALVFLSDRLWDTPPLLRLLCTLAGLGVLFYFLWGWLRLWVWRRRDMRALAQVVQSRFRRLGDRLLGIVELADENQRPAGVSPALCRAAIRQVSTEAIQLDFRQAVASRKPKIYFLVAVFLVFLVLAPWILIPTAGRNALARWLQPVSSVPRFTFVSLEALPSRLVVPHGEPFQILCRAGFHPFWRPSHALAQFEAQPAVRADFSGNQVLFRIPGQTRPGTLSLRIGDVRRRLRIEPMFRPALQELTATVQLPGYLQYPPGQVPIRQGSLSLLAGSKAAFAGQVSRDLEFASLKLSGADSNVLRSQSMEVTNNRFATVPLALEGTAQCAFEWQDRLGLSNSGPWLLSLETREDQPPLASCPNQPGVVAILQDEVLQIQTVAEDDYGLKELAVQWQCSKRDETGVVAQAQSSLADGSPQTTNLTATFNLAPTLLRLPEESIVTLQATARDYRPDRPPAQSAPYRIYILGQEEHAQLVQQQFEKILAEVEEITRRQENLLESGRQIDEQAASDMKSEETGSKLQEQAADQSDIAEKTAQLARQGAEAIREALRNKSIPTDLLQEWTQQLNTMQNLSQQQMPQASQSLARAGQNAERRDQQLDEALQAEEEILKALQEMQRELTPALDRFLANTLAQRLRKIAKYQNEIEQTLKKALPEVIGLAADKIPPAHRQTNTRLATGQEQSSKDSRQLQDEIARFHQRTSVTNYGTVARQMEETKAAESLAGNSDLIRHNITAQAMQQSIEWAGQFNRWAEILDAARQSEESGGSGGGQGEVSEEALRRLLALLRTRQAEDNLRHHTMALDKGRKGQASYLENSSILSVRQSLLVDDVEGLQDQDPGKFLDQVREAMTDAGSLLLKPETGAPTVAAETDAINLLEAEILAMTRNSESSAQSAAMAMLMQMMGMSPGNQGGGNTAGGTTDRTGGPPEGDATGRNGLPREVEKASGRGLRNVPVEYREALQNYYKGLEQLKR